jgi:hypothetical protein
VTLRRWAGVLCTLALALSAGCGGGSGGGDPLAEPPATTGGGVGTRPTAGGYQPFTVLGTVSDPGIGESSGLAASRRNPGLLWTHNDSGDDPLLYCLDLKATPCGVWRVTGAEAWDWEDMAAGPGPRPGEPYLYLGDIGDNLDQRTEIVVYRIPEPAAAAGGAAVATKAAPAASAPAEALKLRFPDGPHNAEALAVHPTTGDVYVISKDAQAARVYKATAPLDASKATTMVQVGTIRLGTGTRGLEQVTGADISPDGRRAALSTYAQGYELEAPAGGSFDDIWSQPPAPITLGPRLQGESIAYRLDGKALLTTSEIVPFPLQQVERRAP